MCSPQENLSRAAANLIYIEGLLSHRRIPKDVLAKVLRDTMALLEDASSELNKRALT